MPLIDPTTSAGVQPTITGASGFNLEFSDEFNSSTLDPKWQVFTNFGNFSVPSNWDVNAGGNSALRVWPNAPTGYNDWTLRSSGNLPYSRNYGVWEARVKLCRGRGIFPAFWAYKAQDVDPQAEIDIFEAYGYDGGGWNNASANGWRPLNAAWTIWRNGGGGSLIQSGTLKLDDPNPCSATIGQLDLTAAYHIWTMYWEPSGMRFYFDGLPWGCKSGPIWTTAELTNQYGPCAIVFDLWFRKAGLPEPDSTNTPSGPSNSMEIDYVRVWDLSGDLSGTPPASNTFSAVLVTAPASSATLSGIVQFEITGTDIENAELLGSSGATPIYGTFAVNGAHTAATLAWNTAAVSNGAIVVRAVAYDVPAGSVGSSITVMSPRTYFINNVSSSEMPVCTTMDISF